MSKKKLMAILLCSLLCISLAGCNGKQSSIKKDTSNGQAGEMQTGESEDLNVENAFMKQYNIPGHLQQSVMDGTGKHSIEVDADVMVPDGCNPCAYEQSVKTFDQESVIARAKALFDGGEYTFVKPLSCWTYEELSTTYSSKEMEDTDSLLIKDVGTFLEEGFDESHIQTFQDGTFSLGNGKTFYDEIMILEGKIDGEEYHLLAYTTDGVNRYALVKKSVGYYQEHMRFIDYFSFMYTLGEKIYDPAHPEYGSNPILRKMQSSEGRIEVVMDEQSDKLYGENKCQYSLDQAQQMALDYVNKMGDRDYAIANEYGLVDFSYARQVDGIFQLPNTSAPEQLALNGYAFYMQRSYDQISLDQGEGFFWWRNITLNEKRAELDPKGLVVPQELYRVWVSDAGVTKVDIVSPQYEITKQISDVDVMDFQDIQTAAVDTLNEYVKKWESGANAVKPITIQKIQLSYVTVCYDGNYNLVPAWVFQTKDDGPMMILNAIDAQVIYISPENLWPIG